MTSDDRATEIVAAFRARLDRGEAVDPEALAREHPDLADELHRRFDALRRLDRMFGRVAPTAPSLVGRTLGPYRLTAELGSGGMGTVYLATVEKRTGGLAAGERVAVKVVHPHLLLREGFFKRFLREAEIGRRLRHENVVRTLDCDSITAEGSRVDFLAMEYVEGQTLRALLDDVGKLPEELCRHVGREMSKALAAVHAAEAVHRDLKPENVLITKENVVKLMDLGVARIEDDALSQTGAFVGSVRYAAPEQFGLAGARGAGETVPRSPVRAKGDRIDGRADLYSLGLVLYELSTGRHPFAGDDFHDVFRRQMTETARPAGEVNPQLSAFFEEVLRTLLAKKREERFASATELLAVLEDGEKSAWWRGRAGEVRARTHRPLRRVRVPRETAVYGRDAELAKLRGLFDKSKSGDGQVVLIEGEAGIGKSRLVDEFVGRLQRDGEDVNFLFGSYPPGGAATASGAFSTAYREQFGDEGSAPWLEQTPILVPAFDALLRGETPPTGVEPLTKDSLQTVFVHATRALAAERPTIVLIDDLHFAPEEGRSLFAALALAVPSHRILLVGTARPGIDEKWLTNVERLGHVARVPLPRLGAKDLVHLLADTLRSPRLAEELAGRIALKSDGNPYFVFEILRGLREGQFLTQKPDGTWATTQVLRDIQIPSTVRDLVAARIADLDAEDKDLLDVAACLGFEFDAALVAEALGVARVAALRRLARIEARHRLVRSAGERFVFDHHQVQETIYAALPPPLAREYHGSIADAIERIHQAKDKDPATLDGAVCVDLAEHFLKGGLGARALRYLDPALTHLEKGYLHDAAVHLADRALETPGLVVGRARTELLVRKSERLDLLGRRDVQRAALLEALALADSDGDPALRARVLASLGGYFARVSRLDEATAHVRQARDLAQTAGERRLEATATGILGNLARVQSRHAEAMACHERHLALARESGNLRGVAVATGNLGNVLADLGRLAEAQEHHERNLAIAKENGFRSSEASAAGNLALVLYSLGRFAEAMRSHERSLTITRETGERLGESVAIGNVGNVLGVMGRFTEALDHHERHRALAQEIGDRQGECRATCNLGHVLSCLGRFDEAREQDERAIALAREIRHPRLEAHSWGHLGLNCRAQGLLAQAREHIGRHLDISRGFAERESEGMAAANLADVLRPLGLFAEARESLDRALAIAREIGGRNHEGYSLQSLAELADEEGDDAAVERHLSAALAIRCAAGQRAVESDSQYSMAVLRVRQGRIDEARACLERTLATARELGLANLAVLAPARLALLPGRSAAGAADDAIRAFRENETRASMEVRMDARFLLWRATGDVVHLVDAKRRLDFLVEHAPADCRESMLTNVRLHREIASAAAAADGL